MFKGLSSVVIKNFTGVFNWISQTQDDRIKGKRNEKKGEGRLVIDPEDYQQGVMGYLEGYYTFDNMEGAGTFKAKCYMDWSGLVWTYPLNSWTGDPAKSGYIDVPWQSWPLAFSSGEGS